MKGAPTKRQIRATEVQALVQAVLAEQFALDGVGSAYEASDKQYDCRGSVYEITKS